MKFHIQFLGQPLKDGASNFSGVFWNFFQIQGHLVRQKSALVPLDKKMPNERVTVKNVCWRPRLLEETDLDK